MLDLVVQQLVGMYQLGLPRLPAAGRAGELLGRGTGSSLEFQEYREYMPGDDVRRLDWAAYARTDSLMVKLYREEISPRTEILLDASRSMNTAAPAKPLLARQLASLLAQLAGRTGGRPRVLPLTDEPPADGWGLEQIAGLVELSFDGRSNLAELLETRRITLRGLSVRVVISDFLFPHDPDRLIKQLAAGATALWAIQLLGRWEADPSPLGGRRLVDAETGADADAFVDERTIAGYKRRLSRLQQELARNCRRAGAQFVSVTAEQGLATVCREQLCASGILRPL